MPEYLPVFLMIVVVLGMMLAIVGLSQLIGPHKYSKIKMSAYECGKDPIGSPYQKSIIKFHLVGVIFILFDIEVLFLYPWAVSFKFLGLNGFYLMLAFISVLLLGYFYALRRGLFNWD
jgi:NADH-quinone oxidoreductase subunit A